MNLRQPGFTYSASVPFTESKERTNKFKEIGDSRYISHNELDKACFQHDMQLIKYYMIKHLIFLKIQNMMDINVDLLQLFISFLIKNFSRGIKMRLFQTNN